jgi:hypothetical protein
MYDLGMVKVGLDLHPLALTWLLKEATPPEARPPQPGLLARWQKAISPQCWQYFLGYAIIGTWRHLAAGTCNIQRFICSLVT